MHRYVENTNIELRLDDLHYDTHTPHANTDIEVRLNDLHYHTHIARMRRHD